MTNRYSDETLSDLTLGEVSKLQEEHALYEQAVKNLLQLPEDLPPLNAYNQAQAVGKFRRMFDVYLEQEQKVRDNGYKSLAKFIEGNLRRARTDLVPREYLVAPTHHIGGKTTAKKAQKQWEDLLPLLNQCLDDPYLNEADWKNLDEWIQKENYEEFYAYLLWIKRRETQGEFDAPPVDPEVIEVEVTEAQMKALLPARQRLGLEPGPEQPKLPAAGPKKSEEVKWGDTGVTALETNAVSNLARQQVDALSDEEREILTMLSTL